MRTGRSVRNVVIAMDTAAFDGGAHNATLLSAIGLANVGVNVVVFAGTVSAEAMEHSGSTLRFVDAGARELLKHKRLITAARVGLWNFGAQIAFGQVLQRMSTDDTVVHVHTWQKALSVSVLREALRRDFHVALHVHGYELICPAGTFFDFGEGKICNRRPLSPGCIVANCDARSYVHKLWRVARQVVQGRVLRNGKGLYSVIAGSELARRKVSPYLPLHCAVYVIPSPIDVAQAPFTWGGGKSVVFVGRLSREKGAQVLARAAKLADVPVVFAGDGSDRAIIQRINPKAVVTGWLSGEELHRHILAARALVFPSLCLETYGRSVSEAAALGRPAIVSEGSAASDLVIQGRTGLRFACGDVHSLGRALKELEDDTYARRLGEEAYNEYWRHPSSVTGHVAQLLEVYGKILNSDSKPPYAIPESTVAVQNG